MLIRNSALATLGFALSFGIASAAGIRIDAAPAKSLRDAPLYLRISHAKPLTRVVVVATTTMFGNQFSATQSYTANADGSLQADSASLFSNLAAIPPFIHRAFDELAPQTVTFRALNNGTGAAVRITRLAMASDVVQTEVRENGLYGTAFMHRGKRRVPGVIVLGGSEGGTPVSIAALLASHGFNTFALAYFGVDGLPKALANIPLEDAERAANWLASQPTTDPARLAVYGASKGAELALSAAARLPQLRAAVAVKPSSVVFMGLFFGDTEPAPSSWTYRGRSLPYVNGTVPAAVKDAIAGDLAAHRPASYSPDYLARLQNATNLSEASIPVEQINGPVFLVSGDDDQLWPSSYMAAAIIARLRERHHLFADEWLHYQGAGHGIGVAYESYTHSTGNPYLRLGGTPSGNARASLESWPRIVEFLRRMLGVQS